MARITSHILNGLDGTHAGGIPVVLASPSGTHELSATHSDEGGRLEILLEPDHIDPGETVELVFKVSDYWRLQGIEGKTIEQIVLRFTIDDPHSHYHMPVIISPFSYSTWKSG